MKKLIALLLALSMMFIFAACANDGGKADDTTIPTPSETITNAHEPEFEGILYDEDAKLLGEGEGRYVIETDTGYVYLFYNEYVVSEGFNIMIFDSYEEASDKAKDMFVNKELPMYINYELYENYLIYRLLPEHEYGKYLSMPTSDFKAEVGLE